MNGIHTRRRPTAEANRESQERIRNEKVERQQKLLEAQEARYEVALELKKAEDQKRFTGVAPANLAELRAQHQVLTSEVQRLGG